MSSTKSLLSLGLSVSSCVCQRFDKHVHPSFLLFSSSTNFSTINCFLGHVFVFPQFKMLIIVRKIIWMQFLRWLIFGYFYSHICLHHSLFLLLLQICLARRQSSVLFPPWIPCSQWAFIQFSSITLDFLPLQHQPSFVYFLSFSFLRAAFRVIALDSWAEDCLFNCDKSSGENWVFFLL